MARWADGKVRGQDDRKMGWQQDRTTGRQKGRTAGKGDFGEGRRQEAGWREGGKVGGGGARGDLMPRKHASGCDAPSQQLRQRAAAQIPHPPLVTSDLCHRRTRSEPPGRPAPQPGSKPREGPRTAPLEMASTATKPAPPHPFATRIHRGDQP